MVKTPNGIMIASTLTWIEAVIAIAGSLLAVVWGTTVATFLGLTGFVSMFAAAAIAVLAIGIIWILLGYLLWKKNTYAWYILFIVTFISVVLSVVGIFAGFLGITVVASFGALSIMSLLSLVLTAIKLFALVDKDTMKACKVKVGSWKGIVSFLIFLFFILFVARRPPNSLSG